MALFSYYHANPPNHHVNPLQTYKNLIWSKDQEQNSKGTAIVATNTEVVVQAFQIPSFI